MSTVTTAMTTTTCVILARLAPLPWCALAALAACGGDDANADDSSADTETAAEVVDLTGKSVYHMELDFNGQPIVLDRDLTGLDQYFAFGSTHIAPAVSFAMTDSLQFPRTIIFTLNFGIVVPSTDHPIQTADAGSYAFSASPPNIDVFVGGLQYRSQLDGAAGSIEISDWGVETGDTVAGTFSGTLVAEGPTGKTLSVSGSFHFTLPDKNDGQPQ